MNHLEQLRTLASLIDKCDRLTQINAIIDQLGAVAADMNLQRQINRYEADPDWNRRSLLAQRHLNATLAAAKKRKAALLIQREQAEEKKLIEFYRRAVEIAHSSEALKELVDEYKSDLEHMLPRRETHLSVVRSTE